MVQSGAASGTYIPLGYERSTDPATRRTVVRFRYEDKGKPWFYDLMDTATQGAGLTGRRNHAQLRHPVGNMKGLYRWIGQPN